jgi:hypothetical protein
MFWKATDYGGVIDEQVKALPYRLWAPQLDGLRNCDHFCDIDMLGMMMVGYPSAVCIGRHDIAEGVFSASRR